MRTAALDKITHLSSAPLGWKAAWSGERCPAAPSWKSSQIWRRVYCSVTQSCLTLCHPMDCTIPSFPVFTISWSVLKLCLLSRWCHPAISCSVVPFSSCLQSSPDSGSFPMNWLFKSGGQNLGVSASASVLPMNIQDWFPLGLTGLISLQSKGLSRFFTNVTVQKHQFFDTLPSLRSNPHIHTWLLGKPCLWLYGLCEQNNISAF